MRRLKRSLINSNFRHEHLYEEILRRVIRSDELPKKVSDMEEMIGGSRIILCTLSMLSNPGLQSNGTFKIMPVERLIIDEASQINIFEFMVSPTHGPHRLHFLI